jgi:hypothetical protein
VIILHSIKIYHFLRLLSHYQKKNTPKMQISQLINNKKLEKGGEKLDVEITERASIDRAPHAEIHPPECSIQLRSRQSFKRSQHLHKRLVSTPCFVLYPSFLNLNPTNQLYNWFETFADNLARRISERKVIWSCFYFPLTKNSHVKPKPHTMVRFELGAPCS